MRCRTGSSMELKHVIWIRVVQATNQVAVVVEGGAAIAKLIVPVYPIRSAALQSVRILPIPYVVAVGVVVLDLDPIFPACLELARRPQFQLRQVHPLKASASCAQQPCVGTHDLAVIGLVRPTRAAVLIEADVER